MTRRLIVFPALALLLAVLAPACVTHEKKVEDKNRVKVRAPFTKVDVEWERDEDEPKTDVDVDVDD
jgi:ABC-type oligopeptide transport system substrate-binding subunit